jgi:hypothetical protein
MYHSQYELIERIRAVLNALGTGPDIIFVTGQSRIIQLFSLIIGTSIFYHFDTICRTHIVDQILLVGHDPYAIYHVGTINNIYY